MKNWKIFVVKLIVKSFTWNVLPGREGLSQFSSLAKEMNAALTSIAGKHGLKLKINYSQNLLNKQR